LTISGSGGLIAILRDADRRIHGLAPQRFGVAIVSDDPLIAGQFNGQK
jgi:hypothetical protein